MFALLWYPGAASTQSYTWSNVEIAGGGFVLGIIFDPTESGLVYARHLPLGQRWRELGCGNDNNHQFGSTGGAITGDPRVYGRVFVGTSGRGIILASRPRRRSRSAGSGEPGAGLSRHGRRSPK
jgi:hypothetical protein